MDTALCCQKKRDWIFTSAPVQWCIWHICKLNTNKKQNINVLEEHRLPSRDPFSRNAFSFQEDSAEIT